MISKELLHRHKLPILLVLAGCLIALDGAWH